MVDMRKTAESMASTSSKMEATGEKLDRTGDRMEITVKDMAVTGEKFADNVEHLDGVLKTFAELVTQMASEACEKAPSDSALDASGPLSDMQTVKTAVSAQVQGMILSSVNTRVKRDAPMVPGDGRSAIADQLHTDDDEGSDTEHRALPVPQKSPAGPGRNTLPPHRWKPSPQQLIHQEDESYLITTRCLGGQGGAGRRVYSESYTHKECFLPRWDQHAVAKRRL